MEGMGYLIFAGFQARAMGVPGPLSLLSPLWGTNFFRTPTSRVRRERGSNAPIFGKGTEQVRRDPREAARQRFRRWRQ